MFLHPRKSQIDVVQSVGRVMRKAEGKKLFTNIFECGEAGLNDPKSTLEKNGVFLPQDIFLDFEKSNSDRPKVVVYEKKKNSKFKLRVMYLQLVMMAGR